MTVNYQDFTDEELFGLVSKSNDQSAFEQIYTRYADRLYAFVWKRIQNEITSEEIVQEIFISLWQKRKLTEPESFMAYLFSAARYKALSAIRSSKVRHEYALNFAMFLAKNHDNSTQDLVDVNDLKAALDKEIDKLPAQCKTAFRYSRFHDLTNKEIAEKMGISIRTVENYMTQALKYLRKKLKDLDL